MEFRAPLRRVSRSSAVDLSSSIMEWGRGFWIMRIERHL